jgi:hypothetical protein
MRQHIDTEVSSQFHRFRRAPDPGVAVRFSLDRDHLTLGGLITQR